ncbi:MAG: Ig-like domain-containing protein [Clostridiales bacterium]|nr:Ig-like domain-containing protein [Clostridiales bacterium]
MSYSRSKKFLQILGLMIFFVLFLPTTDLALAKDLSSTEETSVLPEIKLNVKSKELVKGKSYKLKVYNTTDTQTVLFKSSDSSIVSVNENGLIKGLEIGSATITVTVKENNKVISSLQCEITVGVPAVSVRLTQSEIVLVTGQKTTLKVLVAPSNTVEVTRFTSLDSDIVSVSTGGRITGKTVGNTYVYALIDNGYSRCKVSVISEDTYATLKEAGYSDLSKITNLEEILQNITADTSSKVTTGSALELNNSKK